ncbi:MAG: FG-GAP repeat protein, partial [Candidatus Eisenbacteria bacterium]|nr:FG-GAP repeat protein [Candidatus Eisenbacteria bacterium]
VSTAGDVNGDGYDDAAIGAPIYANGQTVTTRGTSSSRTTARSSRSKRPIRSEARGESPLHS